MTNNKKNVIWNMIGATSNAFNSLFFTIIVTRINGVDDAGIFTFCFATACLLYCIGNYCGRTFQVTDISKKNSDTDYIYNKLITCIFMLIITISFVVIKGYDIYKSIIFIALCSYKSLEAFSEALYAIIQKNGYLYKVGISLFLKAFVSLIVFILFDILTKDIVVASISIFIINLLIILVYDIPNIKKVNFVKSRFSNQANINIFKTGFFTFILTILSIYLVNAPRYAIDDLSTNSIQTVFGIIIMPATVMILLAQYIIQPSLTDISKCIEEKKYIELKKIIVKLILITVFLGVIVFAVAFMLEVQVLELIYGIELEGYFASMMIIILGSIFYGLITLLSSILVAMRKTLGQTIIYAVMSVISTFIAYILVKETAVEGASITYFITMFSVAIMFAAYTIINMIKYKNKWKSIGG